MRQLFPLVLAVLSLAACGVQKPMSEAQYVQSVRKDMPFAVREFKQIKQDVYAFSCDDYIGMLPDYEVDNEGTLMVWRTSFASTHATQSPQYIWRNIVIDKRNCRILCIDRLLNDGKTFGYVYVLQGETKNIPNGFHWDVTDPRHMLMVAPVLEDQTELSVELLNNLLHNGNKK